ncbi:MAG: T9SS type A sorting domain-containing protein [bacterium]
MKLIVIVHFRILIVFLLISSPVYSQHKKTEELNYKFFVIDKNYLPVFEMLKQNYPNPFNATTIINLSILKTGFVTINIYDVLGKNMVTLLNEEKTQGDYEVEFNGSYLPSGIYFYQIKADEFVQAKKML